MVFATPFGNDKAFLKRKETLERWSKKYDAVPTGEFRKPPYAHIPMTKNVPIPLHTEVIDNEWLEGFRFDKVVSRWSTSNKVMRVFDPRGFALEVYSDCYSSIILNGQIDRGLIKGRCIWANTKPYLIMEGSAEHEEWQEENKKVEDRHKFVPGDIVNGYHTYLGQFYRLVVRFKYFGSRQIGKYGNDWARSQIFKSVMKHEVGDLKRPTKFLHSNQEHYSNIFKKEWYKSDKFTGRNESYQDLIDAFEFGQFAPNSYTHEVSIIYRTREEFEAAVAEHSANGYLAFKKRYLHLYPDTIVSDHQYENETDVLS